MSDDKKDFNSGVGLFILIIIGVFLYWGYNKHQERKREEEASRRESDAAAAVLFGGVLNAVLGNNAQSGIARELKGPDNGVRSTLDMPKGVSSVPSSVTIGPNGERYYNYDRVLPP